MDNESRGHWTYNAPIIILWFKSVQDSEIY